MSLASTSHKIRGEGLEMEKVAVERAREMCSERERMCIREERDSVQGRRENVCNRGKRCGAGAEKKITRREGEGPCKREREGEKF